MTLLADRYRLTHRIGAGSFATVHAAVDEREGSAVAVKVLKDLARTQPRMVERFRREARTLASLDHPNLVRVLDVGCDAGRDFIVMGLVDGCSLGERLDDGPPLPLVEAVGLALQLLSGLAAVHALGIVHRDVKPNNVLLSGQVAVLADFGIAAQVGDPDEGRITRTGATLGTFGYMAPEQLVDAKNVGIQADLYGLGATLYHALTGTPPANLHASDARSPRWQRLPEALVPVLQRALRLDPAERWPDALAFGRALRGALADPDRAGLDDPAAWPAPHPALGPPPPPAGPANPGSGTASRDSLWDLPEPSPPASRGQLLIPAAVGIVGGLVLAGLLAWLW